MSVRRERGMPKKSFVKILVLALCAGIAAFSCVTSPPARNGVEGPGDAVVEDAEAVETVEPVEAPGEDGAASGDDAAAAGDAPEDPESGGVTPFEEDDDNEEIPEVHSPLPEGEPDEAAGKLEEPFADLPEITEAPPSPGEAAGPGLEEPAAPVPGGAPEALRDTGELPGSPAPAASPSGALPPPGKPAPEPEKGPPPPPPFLGPVEEAVPPGEREPLPLPLNPVPEPPARAPPPAVPGEGAAFSRMVRATVGQIVEIPFRGAGWVYLGELSSRRGLAYDSRRLDPEGQRFMFRCETPGTYVLKFYKQDFIRDYILNDQVQVIVGEAPERAGIGLFNPPVDRGRVIAEPRWPPREGEEGSRESLPGTGPRGGEETAASGNPPEEAAPGLAEGAPSPPPETAPGAAPERGGPEEPAAGDSPEDSPPEDYVRRALEEYHAGRIAQALTVMDSFRRRFPSGTDEAWWLLGQLLEANSPARDIRLALEYYRRLVREFPQSQRVPAALRRIAYLERFYFHIQ